MPTNKTIPLTPIANLQEDLKGFIPLSISIGPKQDLFVLLSEQQPPLIEGRFPPTVTEEHYSYKVLRLKDGEKKVLNLQNEQWNYHYVQPIDDDYVLLVCANSRYHNAENIDQNARVYDWNGQFIRSFCLGDGIDHIYTTEEHHIWTGYFDEGVYGNRGWENPIGSSGMVGWDREGHILDNGDDRKLIGECLALNVAPDNEVWYFVGERAQIGLLDGGRECQFATDALGFQTFAVQGDKMMVHRHYFDNHHCFELERNENEFSIVHEVNFIKPDGNVLLPQLTSNRADMLLFLDDSELYFYKIP
ncbi:hypothetical protein [Sporosarcina sp.]|uniref:hypothetical protein n=1 Tax=Sporosarcina sp. TaxID=49982 RepID=UPI002614DFE9|nr:hypothetical protein [Sporosarcina sp.]